MNLDPRDPDGARTRLLFKLLGGLVIAGVVIGLVVGVLGTTVLRSMGLRDQPPPPAASSAGQAEPPESTDDETTDEPDTNDDASTNVAEHNGRPSRPSVLRALPRRAAPGEEVTLRGRLRGVHGGSLQVERREDGTWEDFPVVASVNPNGTFSTYIITSMTGPNVFRLSHDRTGRSTPTVRVMID